MALTALICLTLASVAQAGCPHEGVAQRWSDAGTWGADGIPGKDAVLELNKPVLLDTETARLKSVTLKKGGKLIFDPKVAKAKITANFIFADEGGEFWIGSEDCPFTGQAEVLLTGKINRRQTSLITSNY